MLGIAALLLIAAVLSVPYIASTQILRGRIALELSAWTGYQVKLGAAPEIDLWPVFRTRLRGVTMASWTGDDKQPAIDAEEVEADLSPLAALRGDIEFTSIRFVRPTIRLMRKDGELRLAQNSDAGRIAGAVSLARSLVAAKPASPDSSRLPSEPMGTVEFRDARVVLEDAGGEQELMSSITGKLSWPSLNRPASLTATGIWHGENVAVSASSDQPLMLLAGSNAPLSLSLQSAPANISFEGTANLSSSSFVDGHVTASTPSLKRLVEWSGAEFSPASAIGTVSVDGHVNGTAQRMRLENVKLVLDGNPGNGTLEVATDQDVPAISGTLAFDQIDLRSFLASLSSLGVHTGAAGGGITASLVDKVKLDLRLSAATATAGTISLTDVGATAQVRSGLAAFDISDAKVFGGSVQAGLRIDHGNGANTVEIRVLGDNIDSAAFATAMDLKKLAPASRGKVSVILKGTGHTWQDVLATADGSVTASFGPGSLPGLDLPAFLKRAGQGTFFALADVADGALPFQSLNLKADFNDGVARIDKATLVTADQVIAIAGIVPSLGRGLALSGTIYPVKRDAKVTATPTAAFFVGGSWDTPYVSPIVPNWPIQ